MRPASFGRYQQTPTRLAELLLTLQAGGPKTKQQLLQQVPSYRAQQAHKSVSSLQRILLRDLQTLRSCGYRVTTHGQAGSTSRYELAVTTVPQLQLNSLEKLLLRAALNNWQSHNRGGEVFAVRCKLAPQLYDAANPLLELSVTNPAEMLLLTGLAESIAAGVQISFNYAKPDSPVQQREVSPVRLHSSQNRWHLIALDSSSGLMRTFLVARISQLKQLATPAAAVSTQQLQNQLAQLSTVTNSLTAQLTVPLTAPASWHLLRSYYAAAPAPTGRCELRYGDAQVLAEQLVQLGAGVVIHAPTSLRQRYERLLQTITAQHQQPHSENFVTPQNTAHLPTPAASRLANDTRCLLLWGLLKILAPSGDFLLHPVAKLFGISPAALVEVLGQLEQLCQAAAEIPAAGSAQLHYDAAALTVRAARADSAAMAAPDGVWEAGWVSLEGSLTLPDPQLSDTEITLLAQCLAALEPLLPAQLQTVAVELRQRLSENQAELIVTSQSTAPPPSAAAASLLGSEFSTKEVFSFTYTSATGARSQRSVIPLGLEHSGGAWQLRALCLQRLAVRHFTISQLSELRRQRRADFLAAAGIAAATIAPLLQGSIQNSAAPAQTLTVTVAVRAPERSRLHAFHPVYLAEPAAANGVANAASSAGSETTTVPWYFARVKLWQPQNVLRLVQAAPGCVEVLEPAELRQLVATWAQQLLSAH